VTKILAIDDQKSNLVALTTLFSKVFPDIWVITAFSGNEGIEKAVAEKPDVILLDLVMPFMDGFETCKRLKEDNFLKHIPVIMMTATKASSAIRNKVMKSGAEIFLSKPIDKAELTAQVSSMIRLKKSEDQIRQENIQLEELVRQRTEALERELEERKQTEESLHVQRIELEIQNLELREMQKELEASRARYFDLYDLAPVGYLTITEKGIIIDANLTAVVLLGVPRKAIVKQSLTRFISTADQKIYYQHCKQLFKTGLPQVYELRMVRKNADPFWSQLDTAMTQDINGVPICRVVVSDITLRKQTEESLQESEKQFRALFDNVPVGLYRTTPEGKILLANRVIYKMLGFSDLENISLKNLEECGFEPTYRREQFIEEIEKNGEVKDLEAKWICCNGEVIIVRENAKLIRDSYGTPLYYDGTVENITERKRVEEERKEALIKAEAVDRLKTAFMNNISHEMRTPLNGILGFSQLITQPDLTNKEKENFYTLIKSSSNRLINTITNYMDISLIASGNMEVKRKSIDLHHTLYQLCDQFQSLCNVKNLELHLNIPSKTENIILYSDGELFQKVLSHLIDNAIKFTSKGGITFGYTIKSGSLEFFVKDTGSGISKEAQARIFDIFMQEEATHSRSYEGSGLGLSIARGLIRLLGGVIRVESEKGGGSVFTFDLPYEKSDTGITKIMEIENDVPLIVNPVILIAEDDESSLSYLEAILKKIEVTIIPALDGKEAVDKCREHPEISMVLMDMKMPVMDGMKATHEIKSFRENLPIIAITAFAMTGDEKRTLAAGCDDYIAKPVSKEVLLAKLKRYGMMV